DGDMDVLSASWIDDKIAWYENLSTVGLVYNEPVVAPIIHHLYNNYPNPFNPNTTIKYTTLRSGNVEIHIYDVSGNYICTLEDRYLSAGTYEVQWDGRNSNGLLLSSGVYFYQVKSGNSNIVKKMQLIK
ncbi:T9SS type A sorting domain-containing protein, partial [bacterium]|nr:T9SS type A sorting domain-containing protein [bacterium]